MTLHTTVQTMLQEECLKVQTAQQQSITCLKSQLTLLPSTDAYLMGEPSHVEWFNIMHSHIKLPEELGSNMILYFDFKNRGSSALSLSICAQARTCILTTVFHNNNLE